MVDQVRLAALEQAESRNMLGRTQRGALAELRRRMRSQLNEVSRYVEPALTMASGAIAEPVSGLVGLAGLPFGVDASSGAIQRTQDALTYQPRTHAGQEGLSGLQGFMQPVADAFTGASEGLGDAAFNATDSPALAAAAYSVPTMAMEALGLKGVRAAGRTGRLGAQYEIGDIGGQASGQRGIFAGVRAKTADLDALDNAKQLAESGASRDKIWNETGWFKDVDGQWKFEIDDSGALVEQLERAPRGHERLIHNQVQSSYPETWGEMNQSIYPSMFPEGKTLDDNSITATGPTSELRRQVALHELQHVVQGREGFAEGGSQLDFSDLPSEKILDTEFIAALNKHNAVLDKYGFNPDDKITPDKLNSMKPSDIEAELEDQMHWLDDEIRDNSELKDVWPPGLMGDPMVDPAFAAYRRLAGEAEARNVETRRDYTPEQRRATPPWATLDVPEGELTIRRSKQ